MRIGFDVDGVLADFNTRFIDRVIDVTGRDLFPPRPFDIPCWDYPQHYGYTAEENTKVWQDVMADDLFWLSLNAYDNAQNVIWELSNLSAIGDADVYFVTSRPGIKTKLQTEIWLTRYGFYLPTVLISSNKGAIAKGLQLDAYIDDRWENCVDVVTATKPNPDLAPLCQTFLLDRTWNRDKVNSYIWRITEPSVMLDILGLSNVGQDAGTVKAA